MVVVSVALSFPGGVLVHIVVLIKVFLQSLSSRGIVVVLLLPSLHEPSSFLRGLMMLKLGIRVAVGAFIVGLVVVIVLRSFVGAGEEFPGGPLVVEVGGLALAFLVLVLRFGESVGAVFGAFEGRFSGRVLWDIFVLAVFSLRRDVLVVFSFELDFEDFDDFVLVANLFGFKGFDGCLFVLELSEAEAS